MVSPHLEIPTLATAVNDLPTLMDDQTNLLDQALQGDVDFVVTAGGTIVISKTISLRNFFFNLTGTPSADFNLDFPINNRYFAINNKSGKKAMIRIDGGGGMTVSVLDGQMRILYIDGADVINVTGAGAPSQETLVIRGTDFAIMTADLTPIDWNNETRDEGNWHDNSTDPEQIKVGEGIFDAVAEGGNAAFAIFEIGAPFNLRDINVENFLRSQQIQLAKAITDQIESSIRFEILEGVRAGESIPQISLRIQGIWDKPIQVNVPPRLNANGEVIRAGYSYALDVETWATTVARTETARGFIEGKLDGYRQTGVVAKVQFVVTPDERLCPACSILEGAEFKLVDAGGIIPVHPSCRCTFIPLVDLNVATKATALDNVIAVSA